MATARVSKSEWIANKDNEKQILETKLGKFLKDAIETKEGMQALTEHYRISGLYNYSFYNSMMILMQGGRHCIAQSFNGWKKLERMVTKGEKSRISVYAPMFLKEKDAFGNEEDKLIGFKLVPVFAQTQTTGKALEYDHNSVECMDVAYDKVAKVLTDLTGAKVIETFTGSARGYSDGKIMAVSEMSNDTDKCKTLIHEAVHTLIHCNDKESKVSREVKEVEAESTAYLVMSYLGLDFELSKAYVSAYKSGISDARHGIIIRSADKIIKALKKEMTQEEQFLVSI